jgi:Pvc16 N-terminal domain
MKNVPAPLEPVRGQHRPAPLALDLSYLVTPFTNSGENDQVLMGKTMQVLHDNACVYVRDQLNAVVDEIRVVFCRLPLEEVTRIWEALQEPYRLSVCYLVRVIRIDSTQLDESAPVLEIATGQAVTAG